MKMTKRGIVYLLILSLLGVVALLLLVNLYFNKHLQGNIF